MKNKTLIIKIDDLKLLPQTYEFFQTKKTKDIPIFIVSIACFFFILLFWMSFTKIDVYIKGTAILNPIEYKDIKNEPMKAQVKMNILEIDKVKIGQQVKINLQNNSLKSYPQLNGIITGINYELFDNSGELSFYIEVIIEEPYFYTSDRKKINISSRLCSEAYIFISRKSILKLLFEKLNFVI